MISDEYPDDQTEEQEWPGVAVYRGQLYAISGILAEFILDYQAYDPEWCAKAVAAAFRGGILTITAETIPRFLRVMKARHLTAQEGQELAHSNVNEPDLLAFIDFDRQRYVHSYYDLPLEKYVPKGWRGALGDPRAALRQWYTRV